MAECACGVPSEACPLSDSLHERMQTIVSERALPEYSHQHLADDLELRLLREIVAETARVWKLPPTDASVQKVLTQAHHVDRALLKPLREPPYA